jgi:putative tryptophan/tyrosine transport system substrate-binding protein
MGKTVELIPEVLLSAHRVAALANASDPFSKLFSTEYGLVGKSPGMLVRNSHITAAPSVYPRFSS